LLNSAAAIGNLDNIRDLIFNTKHITVASAHNEGEDDRGCDIINAQSPQTGHTPLFNAVLCGHLRVTQFLLTHGARCNIPDHTGRNPLNVAQGRPDRADIYESLLAYASEEDLCAPVVEVSDAELYTNHWMHEDEKSEAALQLMKYCYLGEGHFDKVVQVIEDFGADVNYRSAHSLSPLLVATNENHNNLVKYLIDGGADINDVDRNNTTALMLACRNQNRSLALYLINNRADLTIVDTVNGDTALHIICQNDMVDLMEDIVNLPRSVLRRLDLKVENTINGNNLLHIAVLVNSVQMASLLVQQGMDVNTCNMHDDMNSALHYACMNLYAPLVEFLLSKQAQANVSNRQGVTPLAIVLRHHDLPLGRLLHTHGADITECHASTGDSFLHRACRKGKVDIAKWLVRAGLDPNAENNAGITATKLAHSSGREDLLEWILAWILAIQLNKPIEEVLTEAHTLPFPEPHVVRARVKARSAAPAPAPAGFLSSGVELEEEEYRHEDPTDILEFDA
jgi:ankyrin